MPRAKAAAAAKKPKAAKTYQMAERLPEGEILRDLKKGEWKLGKPIGSGGFGLLYLGDVNSDRPVGPDAKYVIKIEPHENGPLFVELSFYHRCGQELDIKNWMESKKLRFLGVPTFIATGSHMSKKQKCRFMVMPRFGTDLQKLFEEGGKKFPLKTVCTLALRLVYLVDYGLAQRFRPRDDTSGSAHHPYKEDPRKKHDGTIEFTSRDAHKGVGTSRRGDLEILGYCLLQWLCSRLPWEDNLQNPDYVSEQKHKYMENIPKLLLKCFPGDPYPEIIKKYLQYVVSLDYEEAPDYQMLRRMFHDALKAKKLKDDGVLQFNVPAVMSVKKTGRKRLSQELPVSEDEESPPKRARGGRTDSPAVIKRQAASPASRSPAVRKAAPAVRKAAPKTQTESWKNSLAFTNSMQPPKRKSPQKPGDPEQLCDLFEDEESPPKRARGGRTDSPALIKRQAASPASRSPAVRKAAPKTETELWENSLASTNSMQPPKRKSPQKSASAAAAVSASKRSKIQKLKANVGTQTSPGLRGLRRRRKK